MFIGHVKKYVLWRGRWKPLDGASNLPTAAMANLYMALKPFPSVNYSFSFWCCIYSCFFSLRFKHTVVRATQKCISQLTCWTLQLLTVMFPSVGRVGDGGRAVSVSPWAGTATGEGACVPVCGFWPYLGQRRRWSSPCHKSHLIQFYNTALTISLMPYFLSKTKYLTICEHLYLLFSLANKEKSYFFFAFFPL